MIFNKNVKYIDGITIAVLTAIGMLFFFFLGEKGVVYHADSMTFIEDTSRLPVLYRLYSEFVQFCLRFFGEYYICVIQNVIAIISVGVLTNAIGRIYVLDRISIIIVFICICLPYGFSLPEYVVTHAIMTEGITLSIFNLYFASIIKLFMIPKCKKNAYLWTFVTCVWMLFNRPQLIIMLVITGVLIITENVIKIALKYNLIKRIAIVITYIIGCVGIVWFIMTMSLFYLSNSTSYSQLVDAISGKVVFIMDVNDDRLYEEEDVREAYRSLWNNINNDSEEGLFNNVQTGVLEGDKLFRMININARESGSIITSFYYHFHGDMDYNEKGMDVMHARNHILATELKEHGGACIKLVFKMMPISLVGSVFIQPEKYIEMCYIITALIYVVALSLVGYDIYTNKGKPHASIPLLIALSIIIMNAFACNVILYGQQRYVIYCFGIFYASLYLQIRDMWKSVKDEWS